MEEQQSSVIRTPDELTKEIDEIELKFKRVQTAFTIYGPAYAEAISSKLDMALEELYNLAAFVGGMNDLQPDLHQEEKDILHTSVMAKFEETKTKSDHAWKALCAAHAMASGTDLRDYSLRLVGEAAKNHLSTFSIEHSGVEGSITTANERITTLHRARDDVENMRAALENNRWHTDASKIAANVGFGILTFGVWSIVGAVSPQNSCTEVVGLEGQGRALEHQLAENHSALTETQNSLSELESRKTNLEQEQKLLRIVLERITGVEESFKEKTMEIDKMTRDIVAAKNVAEPIWKRIARLESTATVVTRHAAVQKEYTDALIDMCALGCIDMRRARIIDRILRQISSCPAVVKTKSLEGKLEQVNNTCRQMLSQGSID